MAENKPQDNDRFGGVREAGSVATPLARLQTLAGDTDEAVRAALLRNAIFAPHADVHAKQLLVHPGATWISRQAVAGSPYVGPEVLRQVFSGRELYVLLELVNNPACPQDILRTIVREEHYAEFTNTPVEDERLSPELQHAHQRRVYQALHTIATGRLAGSGAADQRVEVEIPQAAE